MPGSGNPLFLRAHEGVPKTFCNGFSAADAEDFLKPLPLNLAGRDAGEYFLEHGAGNSGHCELGCLGDHDDSSSAAVYMAHTVDGGKTWTVGTALVGVSAVMQWSFVNATLAYAAAVTDAHDSTVLALGVAKPPPGPGPPSPGGSFTQTQCSDDNCSVACSSHAFPENQCLQTTSGGSAKVLCSKDGKELITQDYSTTDCSGAFKNQTEPANKCLKSSSGGSFDNSCSSKFFAVLAYEFTGYKIV